MKTRYVLAAAAGVATLATGAGIAAAQTDDGTLTDTITPSTVDDGTDSTVTTPEADDTTDDGTDGTAPSDDSSSSGDAKEGCGDRAGDGGGVAGAAIGPPTARRRPPRPRPPRRRPPRPRPRRPRPPTAAADHRLQPAPPARWGPAPPGPTGGSRARSTSAGRSGSPANSRRTHGPVSSLRCPHPRVARSSTLPPARRCAPSHHWTSTARLSMSTRRSHRPDAAACRPPERVGRGGCRAPPGCATLWGLLASGPGQTHDGGGAGR